MLGADLDLSNQSVELSEWLSDDETIIYHTQRSIRACAKLHYTDTGYEHHQQTKICHIPTSWHVKMLGSGIAMWQICCRIVVSSSVGGVVQHVCSRCPCSRFWAYQQTTEHLPGTGIKRPAVLVGWHLSLLTFYKTVESCITSIKRTKHISHSWHVMLRHVTWQCCSQWLLSTGGW